MKTFSKHFINRFTLAALDVIDVAPFIGALRVIITMSKSLCVIVYLFASSAVAEVRLALPNGWEVLGTVLYSSGAKVGELTPSKAWPYSSGDKFISSFKFGFEDDFETTRFISSGNEGDIYWVCRSAEYEGAAGEYGIWYVRRFWVNGPILTLYSYKSCTENWRDAVKLASTVSE